MVNGMSDQLEGRPIRPVILAGGAGTRLWPLSTVNRPKHLLPLLGPDTLLDRTIARFDGTFAPPIIVANEAQEADLLAVLPEGARLVLEPMKRDSAPAIALAAVLAEDDELLLICPSDHHIADVSAYREAIALARPAAEAGGIVTFGIEPDHPATGFGYIAAGEGSGVRPVARFVEKPPLDRAEAMLAAGGHYWNAGIFLASAATWREELAAYAPDIFSAASEALEQGTAEGPVIRVGQAAFERSPSRSIDYAVMEHSRKVAVVPVAMGWSDIGSWQALLEAAAKDAAGNAIGEGVLALDCRDTLIRTNGPRVAAIGVEGLVIVATPGAVLVMRAEEAQRVREAAEWHQKETGDGGEASDRD